MGCARGIRRRGWQCHGDSSPALVATGGVNSDALDASPLRIDLVGETGTAEVARLAVDEGLCEIVVLECPEGPGGAEYYALETSKNIGS